MVSPLCMYMQIVVHSHSDADANSPDTGHVDLQPVSTLSLPT